MSFLTQVFWGVSYLHPHWQTPSHILRLQTGIIIVDDNYFPNKKNSNVNIIFFPLVILISKSLFYRHKHQTHTKLKQMKEKKSVILTMGIYPKSKQNYFNIGYKISKITLREYIQNSYWSFHMLNYTKVVCLYINKINYIIRLVIQSSWK